MFCQKRVGRHGAVFTMPKFRTMVANAEQILASRPEMAEWDGPVFRIRWDPRLTPLGSWLRRYSLDELPQLFSVVAGHMSLVGPRPHLVEEAAGYLPWHRRRLDVLPGLTCLWQISGRHDLDFNAWIHLDLEYIDTWTPWRDLVILARTVPVVLFGKGAY